MPRKTLGKYLVAAPRICRSKLTFKGTEKKRRRARLFCCNHKSTGGCWGRIGSAARFGWRNSVVLKVPGDSLSPICRKRTYLQCYLNLLLESSLWRHHRESRCGGGFSHPGFACFRGAIGTILASDRTRESMAPGAAVLAT